MTQPHPPSGALTSGSILALLVDPFSVLEDIAAGTVLCPPASTLRVLAFFPILGMDDAFSIMAPKPEVAPWPRFD